MARREMSGDKRGRLLKGREERGDREALVLHREGFLFFLLPPQPSPAPGAFSMRMRRCRGCGAISRCDLSPGQESRQDGVDSHPTSQKSDPPAPGCCSGQVRPQCCPGQVRPQCCPRHPRVLLLLLLHPRPWKTHPPCVPSFLTLPTWGFWGESHSRNWKIPLKSSSPASLSPGSATTAPVPKCHIHWF